MNMQVEQKKLKRGRPPGAKNRHSPVVANARRAIAEFVEGNLPKFQGWLEQVAEGTPYRDNQGRLIRNEAGAILYQVKPDPATAIKLVADICEYHLPKLSRAEVSSVNVSANLGTLTLEQLREMRANLLEQRGDPMEARTIDITPTQEIPEWITK